VRLFALIFVPIHVSAQVLPFESFTVKDGLLGNDILFITQDLRGYLWIGTRDGVCLFDGTRFTKLTSAGGKVPGLVRVVAEDRVANQRVWLLGADGSLSMWSRTHCEQFGYDSIKAWTGNITSLCVDASGILWAGTEETLLQVVDGRIRPVQLGTQIRFPHLIKEQGDSIVWIASRSGLFRVREATGACTRISLGGFDGKVINALAFDEDGAVWAGITDGFILRIEQSRVIAWRKVEPFTFLVQDKLGTFWFGAYLGLYRMTNPLASRSRVEHLTVDNGLSENTLRQAFVDREGNLWLGGISQGLVKLSDDCLVRFPMRDINPPYQYSVGASDFNSHVWVVARSGLWEFWRTGGTGWRSKRHDELKERGTAPPFTVFDIETTDHTGIKPYSLFCARDSLLWIVFSNGQIVGYAIHGGTGGASSLDPQQVLRPGHEIPHEFPKAMVVDHRGLLWYGTGARIIMHDLLRRSARGRSFNEVPALTGVNSARVLFEDRSGSIWAGFNAGGVMRLDADSVLRGAFHAVPGAETTGGGSVRAICQDSIGGIWIATAGAGLFLGTPDSMQCLAAREGFPSNTVLSLCTDRNGRLWIGASNGVSVLDTSASVAPVRPSIFSGEFCVQSGQTHDSTMWFVGRSGVLLYREREKSLSVPPPEVSVTAFHVNGRPLDFESDVHLSHEDNTCAIEFVAPFFREPGLLVYQFRLANLDTAWSVPQRNGRVTFAFLPPGDYAFEVRARIVGSPTASGPTSLRFSIASPFWKTWWFSSAVLVALLGAIGGSLRHFERRKMLSRLHALELQHALHEDRLRIAQDMHDGVGSALTEIAYLSELARQKPNEAPTYVRDIALRTADLIDMVSEIVWAMNPLNDTLDNLLAHIRRHAVGFLDLAGIRCTVEMPGELPSHPVAGRDRRNVLLVVKEALHNVVKHSRATEVRLTISFSTGFVEIGIHDNGIGMHSMEQPGHEHGLANMRRRIGEMGGDCTVSSEPGLGTRVTVRFPVLAAGISG